MTTVQLTINRTGWWTFRDVLAKRQAFRTHGSLRGDPDTFDTGRLPEPWRTEYNNRRAFIDYTVRSYATPIAWHDTERGWIAPDVSYSVTTSKSQSRIATAVAALNDPDNPMYAYGKED